MTAKKENPKKKLAKKLSERYLRNAGEYYLNRFPASSAHFLSVMTRKIDRSCCDHPDQNRQEWIDHIKDTLIPYFEKLGFLNDDLYSTALFNSLKNKGLSKIKIKSKMIQKSVSPHLIDDLLNDGFDDKAAVIRFAEKKKIGRYNKNGYADYQAKQKDLGKLARAGFSYDVAMSVFDE
jgi:regulatory protein